MRVVLGDQHRIGPAPFLDRRRDLIDLRVAVRAGVARIGNELRDRPALHLVGGPGSHLLFPVGFAVGRQSGGISFQRHERRDDDPLDPLQRLGRLLELAGQLGKPEQGHLASGVSLEGADDEPACDRLGLADLAVLLAVEERDFLFQDLVEQRPEVLAALRPPAGITRCAGLETAVNRRLAVAHLVVPCALRAGCHGLSARLRRRSQFRRRSLVGRQPPDGERLLLNVVLEFAGLLGNAHERHQASRVAFERADDEAPHEWLRPS